MAELKEIFDMVTNKTEPDLDAWQQQERRQRRRGTGRRAAAFAVAAAVLAIAIVAIAALRDAPANQPAASTTPPPLVGATALVAYDVGIRNQVAVCRRTSPRSGAASRQDGQSIAFLRSVQGHDADLRVGIDGTGGEASDRTSGAARMRLRLVRPHMVAGRHTDRVLRHQRGRKPGHLRARLERPGTVRRLTHETGDLIRDDARMVAGRHPDRVRTGRRGKPPPLGAVPSRSAPCGPTAGSTRS